MSATMTAKEATGTFLMLVTKITMVAKVSTGTFLNLATNATKAIIKSMIISVTKAAMIREVTIAPKETR